MTGLMTNEDIEKMNDIAEKILSYLNVIIMDNNYHTYQYYLYEIQQEINKIDNYDKKLFIKTLISNIRNKKIKSLLWTNLALDLYFE
jgi:hypothetical protein